MRPSSATSPGTCGRRSRARARRSSSSARTSTRCRTAGGSTAASGCCAALEVLRAHKGETPAVTLKLIDWADEEGARFGRCLLGSSAAAGTLDPDAVRAPQGQPGHRAAGRAEGERRRPRHDGRGRAARDRRLPRAAHRAGPAPGGGGQARRGRDRLLRRRAPRDHLHRQGQPRRQHADGPAPRRVPGRGALRPRGAGIGDDARRRRHDRHRHRRARHPDDHQPALRGHARPARLHSPSSCATCSPTSSRPPTRSREEEGVEVEWTRIWQIDPIPFDETLVDLAAQAVGEITGDDDPPRLPSGALHDAAEVARRAPDGDGLLSSSTDGVSHSPKEDTPEDDLRVALQAYGRLYELTAGMISAP